MLKINLQNFAESIEGVEGIEGADFIEVPGSDLGIEESEQEEVAEEESADLEVEDIDNDNEAQEKPVKQDDGKVPRNVLVAERKKWQEKMKALEAKAQIADHMAEATGKTPEQIIAEIDSWKAQRLIETEGLPESYAKQLVAQERRLSEMEKALKKQEFAAEIESLKTQFPGIVTHQEEVVEFANRHGMTAKQAYYALHGDEVHQDMQTLTEQRVLANQQKKQGARIDTLPAGQQKQTKITLTKEELKFAQDIGMSPLDYQKAKHSTSYEAYEKNFKKKTR